MILMKKLYFKGIGLSLFSWFDGEVIFLHDPFYGGAFDGAGVFVERGLFAGS